MEPPRHSVIRRRPRAGAGEIGGSPARADAVEGGWVPVLLSGPVAPPHSPAPHTQTLPQGPHGGGAGAATGAASGPGRRHLGPQTPELPAAYEDAEIGGVPRGR
jgi:hypothetical protein